MNRLADWEDYLGRLAWRRIDPDSLTVLTPYEPDAMTPQEELDVFCRAQLARLNDSFEESVRRIRLGPEIAAGELESGHLVYERRQ